jgi:hypothetical protein
MKRAKKREGQITLPPPPLEVDSAPGDCHLLTERLRRACFSVKPPPGLRERILKGNSWRDRAFLSPVQITFGCAPPNE